MHTHKAKKTTDLCCVAVSGAVVAVVDVVLPAGTSGRLQLSEPLLRRLGVLVPEGAPPSPGAQSRDGAQAGGAAAAAADAVLLARRRWQLEALTVVVTPAPGRGAVHPDVYVVAPDDAPIYNETVGAARTGGRSLALALDLAGGQAYSLLVSAGASVRRDVAWPPRAAAPAPLPMEGSPFPPPTFPGKIVGTDVSTQGTWAGKFGADGHVLFGFAPPPTSSSFCATCANMVKIGRAV